MKNALRLLILHFIFIILNFSFASAQEIEWQNTIGGGGGDGLFSIQQTSDSGYILGGSSSSPISGDKTENSNGYEDYWIVKTDSTGNIQWQNTIGGNGPDILTSIQQTIDGGYILGGWTESGLSGDKTENIIGFDDFWIIKTDATGNILWQNTIGGNDIDRISSIQQTFDGGYILGGSSFSSISGDKIENSNGQNDYWILKTDATGNIQWQNTIGGSDVDRLESIHQTNDGGYILGGTSLSSISGDKTENSNGDNDYWIVKTDSLGNIEWDKTIGGNYDDYLYSIRQTNDGGYIVGGHSYSTISGDKTENCNGDYDYWIVKTDSTGNILWQNTIGGSKSDNLNSIYQTFDGGYMLGGYSKSNISGDKTEDNIDSTLNSNDYWIIKVDQSGNIQWQNTIGGIGDDLLYSIQQTISGGYILGGWSRSDISGDKTEDSNGGDDYWIVKLFPDTTTAIDKLQFTNYDLKVFPNPTADEITISGYQLAKGASTTIKIVDVMGKEVYKSDVATLKVKLQTSNLPSGVYFVQVGDGGNISRARFVKQ